MLGPYLAAIATLLASSWRRDPAGAPCEGVGFGCAPSPRDGALLVTFMSAPFAVLATGVGWLVVLALQRGPARHWAGTAQGALAATVVFLLAGSLVAVHLLR
ncbi:hypothetical protein [Thermasporomyces composti]|uniref:Uncharacterized protein n=1 Tax=Thermasporomyces composti TaxID=696763 RepID=A0A3D9V2X1_THECX|nr:hypothetical protein [Thermasporomyces composti]REF36068.1 hypothetical protein DFJ64_1466 [Thermasporomyces composti]